MVQKVSSFRLQFDSTALLTSQYKLKSKILMMNTEIMMIKSSQ